MLGEKFNFEDVFFRDLTVCVLDTLEGQVKWVNRFSSGNVSVQVPFYYSLTGDERFLLDTFADDVVSENRFVELNTDMIPRGHLTMTGFNINSDEFANPNVWLRMVVENEVEIRKVLAKVRAIPITVNYDLEILLANEIDTFKCSQAIMDTMWLYKFMYFEHNFLNIDAVILMPDTNSIEMVREKNLTSDNTIKLKASFEVQTYYPAFRKDRYTSPSYRRRAGDGMVDLQGHTYFNENDPNSEFYTPAGQGFAAGNAGGGAAGAGGAAVGGGAAGGGSVPFSPNSSFNYVGGSNGPYMAGGGLAAGSPGSGNVAGGGGSNPGINSPSTPFGPQGSGIQIPLGGTFTFYSSESSVGGADPFGTSARLFFNDPDYFIVSPKRTKWFNNILRARESASGPITNNPNGQFGPNSNTGNPNN
jgi:hypothetical protein